MKSTMIGVAFLLVFGVAGFTSYNLKSSLGHAEVRIQDLESAVKAKGQEMEKLRQQKDIEITRLSADLAKKQEVTVDNTEELRQKDARIAELEEKMKKAGDFMRQQKEQLNWHQAQMRTLKERLARAEQAR